MADFNTTLTAQGAMRKSVESIFADASFSFWDEGKLLTAPSLVFGTETSRTDVLLKNAADYAEYLRIPIDRARAFVAKVAEAAGAPPSIVRKVAPAEQRREVAERAAAAQRSLRRENDPRAEEEELREAPPKEVVKLMRAAVEDGVAKILAEHPRLSERQARERWYAENPGTRKAMVEMSGREYGQRGPLKKLTSSAQIEAAAKAAEILNANPGLSEQQAYARAYETTPGLMKRLLAEQRGEAS